jgi:hypothetical protein
MMPGPEVQGKGAAAQAAARLGMPGRLLVGLGNDADHDPEKDLAYHLRASADLHYVYLVGLPGRGGWSDWNANGSYVQLRAEAARRHCMVPAFTLYAMAVDGEDNLASASDPAYMAAWWKGWDILLEQLDDYGAPAMLHVEPDFWGFAQLRSQGDPSRVAVSVREHQEDCTDLRDDLSGFGHCLARTLRARAPKVSMGLHASSWAGPPEEVGRFLVAVGASEADLLFVEALDRDAGCFEAGLHPLCQRKDGPWYWDERNETSPNFREHFARMSAIGAEVGLPLVWWQLPLGRPSERPGGHPGHYRDNRVRYFFSHPEEVVAAGGLAMMFGPGEDDQTTVVTDGDQLVDALEGYLRDPTPLP